MSFTSSMTVILAWNLSGKDLRIFLTILDSAIDSKIEGRIHNILEFGIELLKGFILPHPYFFKTTSESLKLYSLYCLGTFIDDIFLNSSLVTPQNKAFKALLLKFATMIVASSQSTGASFGLIQPTSTAYHTCSPRACKKTFIRTFQYA